MSLYFAVTFLSFALLVSLGGSKYGVLERGNSKNFGAYIALSLTLGFECNAQVPCAIGVESLRYFLIN